MSVNMLRDDLQQIRLDVKSSIGFISGGNGSF